MHLIRFIYRGLMTGMPLLTYNPLSKTNFHAPFTVCPKSMYINYKLNESSKNIIENYLQKKSSPFKLIPIKIIEDEDPSYYLSLNIYNCTSPLFLNDNGMTRFEINTYVNDGTNNGTLIIDYLSNAVSMDPINLFKMPSYLIYNNTNIFGADKNKKIDTKLTLSDKDKVVNISPELSIFSDYIYYINGIYDKLFYDNSLINSVCKIPNIQIVNLTLFGITFEKPDNTFYFDNRINLVGSMWDNLNFSLLE